MQNPDSVLPPEEWRDVVGYEGLYEVSSHGKVRKLCGKELKQTPQKRGYLTVWLFKNGKGRSFRVHRLVAVAFIPDPENKPTVNHKDSVTHNNAVSNLEWNTYSENMQHSYDNGRVACNKPREWRAMVGVDKEGNGLFLRGGAEGLYMFGWNKSNLYSCCKGLEKSAYGYVWEYYNE